MRRTTVGILSALALVIAACGDGGETAEPSSASTTVEAVVADTQPDEEQPAPTTTDADKEDQPAAGEEGTGTATIGDMTWELELLPEDGRSACIMEGFLLISLFGVDQEGREVVLTINGPAEGGDVIVQAGDPTINTELWVADSAVYGTLNTIEGMPDGVGATANVSGSSISGSGVFYEDRHLAEVRISGGPYNAGVLEGTFSATCPAG